MTNGGERAQTSTEKPTDYSLSGMLKLTFKKLSKYST